MYKIFFATVQIHRDKNKKQKKGGINLMLVCVQKCLELELFSLFEKHKTERHCSYRSQICKLDLMKSCFLK